MVYEQRAKIIVPTNLPAGEYAADIGSAESYPPEYGGWTEVAGVRLLVKDGIRPGNGP